MTLTGYTDVSEGYDEWEQKMLLYLNVLIRQN
jgi:hypothetical protein